MIIPSCQGQWNFLNRPSSSIPILCAWLPTWSPSTPQSMPPTIGRCGFFEMGTSQPQEKEEKSSTDGFLEMDFPCASWFTEGWGFVSFFPKNPYISFCHFALDLKRHTGRACDGQSMVAWCRSFGWRQDLKDFNHKKCRKTAGPHIEMNRSLRHGFVIIFPSKKTTQEWSLTAKFVSK